MLYRATPDVFAASLPTETLPFTVTVKVPSARISIMLSAATFSSISVPSVLFSVAVPPPMLFSPSTSAELSIQTVMSAAETVIGASVRTMTTPSSRETNAFFLIFYLLHSKILLLQTCLFHIYHTIRTAFFQVNFHNFLKNPSFIFVL